MVFGLANIINRTCGRKISLQHSNSREHFTDLCFYFDVSAGGSWYRLADFEFSDTQQQAMFVAWFFLMIFILMSGLFTTIESMPNWAQNITLFNPIRYFVEIIRTVILKGATFSDISRQFLIMDFYALTINTLAMWSYKKTN